MLLLSFNPLDILLAKLNENSKSVIGCVKYNFPLNGTLVSLNTARVPLATPWERLASVILSYFTYVLFIYLSYISYADRYGIGCPLT